MNYKLKMQLSWLKAKIMITAGERSVACRNKMDCFGLRPRNDDRMGLLRLPAMTIVLQAKENVIASEERAKQSRKGW
jgi:hypothetical protein